MRRSVLIAGALAGVALAVLWAAGGGAAAAGWAQDAARAAQDALAGAIRALRAGEPGALAGLLAVAFGYGVAHAAGPGHGKMLVGAYGMARRVRMLPLAGVALLASLAQASVAVVLVAGGAALFDLTRAELAAVSDRALPPFGHAAIAVLGLWLVWRGARGLRRMGRVQAGAAPGDRPAHGPAQDTAHGHGHDHAHGHAHGHAHDHGHPDGHDHAHGPGCGHAHAPTPDQVAALTGWRDTGLLVAGIALRPCTGAVFLLVLTWQLGLMPAGIAGAYAMGLGTASVTVGAAVLSVWLREGALAALPGTGWLAPALPAVEALAGATLATVGLWLLAGGG